MREDLQKRIRELTAHNLDQLIRLKKERKQGERPIKRRPLHADHHPLSFSQQRLWVVDQLEPHHPAYSIVTSVRMRGPVDVEALKRSFDQLVVRHEMLRTRFLTVDGEARQIIQPAEPFHLLTQDLRGLLTGEREKKWQEILTQETQHPFDLEKGPLLRASLFRIAEEEYRLLITKHHIITDGWSCGIMVQEIILCYEAFSTGANLRLPELQMQYIDYAYEQLEVCQGEKLESLTTYWKNRLGGELPVLQLPSDRPRPSTQSYRGNLIRFSIRAELAEKLRCLFQREGITLFMGLLAAYQTLLYRYSGQEDILVGTPVANRHQTAVENIIGFFVNTLVMRVDLSDAPSFRELFQRVRETVLEAFEHQALPFEKLVDILQPERNLSYQPIFQAEFAVQNSPMQTAQVSNLEVQMEEVGKHTSKFDLSLFIREQGAELLGELEYSTDLFDASTIERMIDHFVIILETMAKSPEIGINQFSILTERESELLLHTWNQTQVVYEPSLLLPQLIEEQTERTPDREAIVFGTDRLTYRELNSQANQLAHYLRHLGIKPDDLVGVYMARSVEMVISLLAIMKAGGAYVPIDPDYPRERIRYMLEDTQASVVLTQETLRHTLPEIENLCRIIAVDGENRPWNALSTNNLSVLIEDTHLAYVIYTSGSTGTPKGVMNTHAGIRNRLLWMQDEYGLDATDRILQKTPFSFDVSVWEFFWPLLAGATLVVARPDGHRDPEYLREVMLSERITTLHFVPSMLILFLEQSKRGTFPHLRRVFCSGEALPYECKERFFEAHPETELHNLYGPTEAAIDVTFFSCQPGDERRTVPIGRPIANTRIYLLDGEKNPVPVGVTGELYIGGVNLARGYWGRPDLTEEKFIADPFSVQNGERLYRTGDLARWQPDGNIEYLGRADFQVKLRGLRIELGEIEHVLCQHKDIREAVVTVVQDRKAAHLVAYVVTCEGAQSDSGAWRIHILKKLPDYMVPSRFVILDEIPLSHNGKVDRKRLPEPEWEQETRQAVHIAPRNDVEKIIAEIWAELFQLEQISVHDNFFSLGGDSIMSIQAASRLRQAGLKLTPKQLIQHQTIAELAQVAVTNQLPPSAPETALHGKVLLTPIQRWFFSRQLAHLHHENQSMLLEVSAELEATTIRLGWEALVRHHDSLRMRFVPSAGGWNQQYEHVTDSVSFSIEDLSRLPLDDQERIQRQRSDEAQASLDISKGPLHRLILFEKGDHRQLLIIIHHLLVDSVSWRILLEDLEHVCLQLSRGESICLPAKTTSYQEWADRLATYARSEVIQRETGYWMEQELYAPEDESGVELCLNTGDMAQRFIIELDTHHTDKLVRLLPKINRLKIQEVVLAALIRSGALGSGNEDFTIDMESHGRETLEEGMDLSRTVGWFTSLYPIRFSPAVGMSRENTLLLVKEKLRRVPAQGIGYGIIRYLGEAEGVRNKSESTTSRLLLFNYLGQIDSSMGQNGFFRPVHRYVGLDRSPKNQRSHWLELNVSIFGQRLRMEWTYHPLVHSPAEMQIYAEATLEEIKAMIRLSEQPDAIGYAPVDFPLTKLLPEEWKEIERQLVRLES
ncbi:amino acid adenylation domain-containing protein [Brevibacillus panacihumi]|uniref:amino acid adenylation domain-containing protein n=1 Tax=Brevibacillus panacihumi TaxID=497735 RepID=UPI003D215814